MSGQVSITQLPTAAALTGSESVPVVQNGVTVQTTTGAVAGAGALNYPFLTVGSTSGLTQARYLSTTGGLSLTDGGVGSTLTINLTGAPSVLNTVGTGIIVKDSSSTVVNRSLTVGSGLTISNADGISGNPAIGVSTNLQNLSSLSSVGFVAGNGSTFSELTFTGTTSQISIASGDGSAGGPVVSIASNPILPGTGSVTIPQGTTAQRSGSNGALRYNTDTAALEAYVNGAWGSINSGSGVVTFSAGTTGLTPSSATSGAITLAGTLNVANGGTGVTSSTGSGSVVLSTSPSLTTPTQVTYETWTSISAPSYVKGRLWYDSAQESLAYYNDATNNAVHIGQETILKVVNNTGSTIAFGSAVYITNVASGSSYPNIALAKADVASTAAVIGITNTAITNGSIGYVVSAGMVTGINTSGLNVGDILYLSPYSAGQIMGTVPPTGYVIQVGVCAYGHASLGSIYTKQTTPLAISANIVNVGQIAIANGGTGASTLAGASIVTYTGSATLTNKRIDPRVTSAASASTLTPDVSAADIYAYTALAAGLTINAPIGTPVDGDKLMFRLLDNGTARALTWNATYTVIGVTLPTTTTISKTTYVGCIYNANNTRWDVVAVTTQA
jgi:hypothetical protein